MKRPRVPLRKRLANALGALLGRQYVRTIWKGAESSRLTADWVARPLSADEEVRTSLTLLRARGRELSRNSAIARQYLNLLGTNVVGARGMILQARVRNNDQSLAKPFNDKIEEAWEEWTSVVTLDGRLDLTRFSVLALKSTATDGEVFIRRHRGKNLPHGLALSLMDPDLVDHEYNRVAGDGQNEVRMGVEVDLNGRRVAYHVWNLPPSTFQAGIQRKRERILAADVFHLFDPLRANQTRGVTWFAPVMYPLRMLEGYIEAELVAARTAAAKMGWFVRKDTGDAGNVQPDKDGNFTTEAAPGTFDFAPDGYTVEAWNPAHPSEAFPEFVKSAMREVSSGLGVSYNALTNDLEGVNYSSIRSGLLIERDTWQSLQQWLIVSFLCPLYEEWLNQAILTGIVPTDARDINRFMEHQFTPRGWAWVDPMKDTQAGVLAVENALTSRQRLLAEQGISFEDVLEELKEEQEMADEAGVDLAAAKPAPPGDQGAGQEDQPAEETPPFAKSNGHSTNRVFTS